MTIPLFAHAPGPVTWIQPPGSIYVFARTQYRGFRKNPYTGAIQDAPLDEFAKWEPTAEDPEPFGGWR